MARWRRGTGQRRRRPRRAEAARRRRPAHPAGEQPGARRPGRRPGLPQVREPPADRLVQAARRVHPDRPAAAERARAPAWSPPAPATTRRASRSPPRCSALRSTVFMPEGAPLPKVAATREYGAEVRLAGHGGRDADRRAGVRGARRARCFIHPFDHRDVIAGQGTVGLEILEQCPDVRTIVVGIGGGGLAAGIAVAVKALRPDVRVVGVQAEGAAAYPPSLAAGRPVPLDARRRWPTASRSAARATCRSRIVGELVDEVARSPRTTCPARCCSAWSGPSWSSSRPGWPRSAALLSDPARFEPPVVAVLSGGNVDPLLLQRMLRHGMAAAGPLPVRSGCASRDRPGCARRRCWRCCRRSTRTSSTSSTCGPTPGCGLAEVEVELHLETTRPEHCAEVAGRAARGGLPVTRLSRRSVARSPVRAPGDRRCDCRARWIASLTATAPADRRPAVRERTGRNHMPGAINAEGRRRRPGQALRR